MRQKYVFIGKQRWSLEELEHFKEEKINVGGVQLRKDFLMTIDKVFYPMRYNLLDYIREELDMDFLINKTNRHYCEIKNPYAPKAEDILNKRYLPLGGIGYSVMIVSKGGKYGLIDEYCNTIIPIENDVICPTLLPQRPYILVKHGNVAYIYHVLKYLIVSNIYENIEIVSQRCPCSKTTDEYFKAYKNGKCGLIHEQGKEIVPPIYDDCFGSSWFCNHDEKHKYIIVTNGCKKGIVNELGEVIAEIIYDKIQFSYPTGVNAKNLEAKGWIGSEDYILIDSCAENFRITGSRVTNDKSTYERYGGAYAQEEMGYSDDDIDTIFDGDPSAYWNID